MWRNQCDLCTWWHMMRVSSSEYLFTFHRPEQHAFAIYGRRLRFTRVALRFSLPNPLFLCGGQNHRAPSPFFIRVSISVSPSSAYRSLPRPFTPPVSNGIACRGHRVRSRSRKCTAHVCANLSIDGSPAPPCQRE